MALMFLDVTRRRRGEGFVTASRNRCVEAETDVLGAHHNPVQDMAALMGGYVDELSQVVITQHRPQMAHLSVRTIIMVRVKITSVHNITARTGVLK